VICSYDLYVFNKSDYQSESLCSHSYTWQLVSEVVGLETELDRDNWCQKWLDWKSAVITERAEPSLVTQGWHDDKPCLVTVDNVAYMTVTRPDIAARWPERQPNQRYVLQTVSGEALPIKKGVFLTSTLCRCPLKIWIFVANITNDFILRGAYDASMGIGRQMLHLAEEELSLRSPGGEAPALPAGCGQWRSDTCTVRGSNDGSIGEHARSGKFPGRTEFREQPSVEQCIGRTLVHDSREVTVRHLNATSLSWKNPPGTLWVSHVAGPTRYGKPEVQGTTPTFQNVILTARPNLRKLNPESWKSSSPSTGTSLLWRGNTTDGPTECYNV
jgi:hypothetical protein